MALPGCTLDSFLYNTKQLTSYTLSNQVIPDSARRAVSFTSGGFTLHGFMVTPLVQKSKSMILYFHGNKESIEQYWDRMEIFYRAGIPVFIFDYRGFGMSDGTSSEESMMEDARAALALVQTFPQARERIVLYGYSLGCFPAIYTASKLDPVSISQYQALICESPFASGEALIQSGTLLDIQGDYLLKGKYDNSSNIKGIRTPFLLFHGVDDKFLDLEHNGAVVFANAPEEIRKQFIRVEGADHTNVPQVYGEGRYIDSIRAFIER